MEIGTQWKKICDYCREHGSITVREAVIMGINSPTKRISEMRRNPAYTVTQEDVTVYTEDGKRKSHYAKYRIREAEGNG